MATTPESMYEKQLAFLIDEARACFISETPARYLCDKIKIYESKLNDKVIRFFGVMKEDQEALDYSEIRIKLLNYFGMNTKTHFFQIIGNSTPCGVKETVFAKKYFREILAEIGDGFLLYGLTGTKVDDRCCINQIINEWIDSHPERAQYVFANIVDLHSPQALREWGYKVAKNVSNFFLVYTNTPRPEARFADDAYFSDSLISKKSFCFSGGIQSFRQIIFMLLRRIEIECISNLKWKTNPSDYKPDSDTYIMLFSASEFLNLILQHSEALHKLSDEEAIEKIIRLKDEYLVTRPLFDPRGEGNGARQALFNVGWQEFLDNRLWKQLPQWLKLSNYCETLDLLYMYTNLNRNSTNLVAEYLESTKPFPNSQGSSPIL